MAQQQAPPAAQAPIVVVVDEVQITSDAMLVLVPGAQHVKDHTPCLSWTTVYDNAGAVTSYTLGQSDAKGAFLPRCRFSVDQQTGTLLDGNHVLNVLFNGAFWSRLLTALDAANLFATSMEKIGVLHQRLAGLAMANPGVWVVSHSDIFLGEDFDAPAVPAPAAGRGRGRGRGGPARPRRRPYQDHRTCSSLRNSRFARSRRAGSCLCCCTRCSLSIWDR